MRLFDAYIAVDWSSKNSPSSTKPRPDAIWSGEQFLTPEGAWREDTQYHRTRAACLAWLEDRLEDLCSRNYRIFLGFDFAYSYPAGFAKAMNLPTDRPAWRAVWDLLNREVKDAPNNRNNRFQAAAVLNGDCGSKVPGPFWGCPRSKENELLKTRKPTFPYPVPSGPALNEFRLVESAWKDIQSVWKIFYPASVGGQSLVGIPCLHHLRFESKWADHSRVWPFETGFTATPTPDKGPFILHSEIWPSAMPLTYDRPIKDEAQVLSVVDWLKTADDQSNLAQHFAKPPHLSPEQEQICRQEEGWIIGAAVKRPAH